MKAFLNAKDRRNQPGNNHWPSSPENPLPQFEVWADKARILPDDPSYEPTYEEKQMAMCILGITAAIYPEDTQIGRAHV